MDSRSPNNEQNLIARTIGMAFLGICLLYIMYSFISQFKSRNAVEEAYGKTTGWIVRYFDRHGSDAGSGRTIDYSYHVNGVTYSRSVYTQVLFRECAEGLDNACTGKRFWVIFSVKDTSKSLINFNMEIQNDSLPLFPNSIGDFQ